MCGRARCTLSPDAVTRATGARPAWRDQHLYSPSFNVAPGTFLPVVVRAPVSAPHSASPRAASASAKMAPGELEVAGNGCAEAEGGEADGRAQEDAGGARGKEEAAEGEDHAAGERGEAAEGRWEEQAEGAVEERAEGEGEVQVMKWGLIPSFSSKAQPPDHYRMFNARCESLHEKASFRRLLPARRCLVLLDGFYEWKKEGSKKQPFYIHMSDERPMVMAGLFDRWTNAQGDELFTFTIVTTAASQRLQWLHDRMPAILASQHHMSAWLHGKLSGPHSIASLCAPYNHPDLVWHAVTPQVGKPSFDGPQCVQAIPLKPAVASTPITQFFARKRQKVPAINAGGSGGVERQEVDVGAVREGHGVKCEEGGSRMKDAEETAVQEAQDEIGVRDGEGSRASEGGEKEQPKGDCEGDEEHDDCQDNCQGAEGVNRRENGLGEGLVPATPLPQDARVHASLPSTQPEQQISGSTLASLVVSTLTSSKLASPVSTKRHQQGARGLRPAPKRRKGSSEAAESDNQMSIRRFFKVP
ncbi:hypothetical protein CLOM_g7472 [Closterium sp. NIES-68]|nr:hypothetical protein CLOM_g7472 [Closterium sp. NIES-68]GJP71737.1 hypothetical protein CLOP_g2537 [Closterium sp. NIES-67]